jgi:hypothetical protein
VIAAGRMQPEPVGGPRGASPAAKPAYSAPARPELGFAEVLQPSPPAPEPADHDACKHENDLQRQQAIAVMGRMRGHGMARDGRKELRHIAQAARFGNL